jgi:signal peptidase II
MRKWLALSAAVLLIDQLTKFAIERTFAVHQAVEITPFLNLVLVYNRGAAFSFLSEASGWQRELFIVIAFSACAWIAWLLRKHSAETLFCLALSLVLGGAIGNVVDRLLIGAVVDFIDVHAHGYHWPAFNAADSAITCGAVLLVWDALRAKRAPPGVPPA